MPKKTHKKKKIKKKRSGYMKFLGHNDFIGEVIHEPKMHVNSSVVFTLGAGCPLLKCMTLCIIEIIGRTYNILTYSKLHCYQYPSGLKLCFYYE